MSTMLIMRGPDGKLDGFTADDRKKYNRMKSELLNLEQGELYKITVWFDRSRPFHNLHMRVVRDVYEAQELFEDFDRLREWLYIGAGHVNWVPGEGSQMVPVPRSFSYGEIDDVEAKLVHEKVVDFLRSSRARATLWPHLPEVQTYEMVEQLLGAYEREHA